MTTKIKLSEAAAQLGLSVQQLQQQLSAKFPKIDWKANSEIPQEIATDLKLHFHEYQETCSHGNALPKGVATNAIEAIASNKQIQEALEYAISEAYNEERTALLVNQSVLQAVEDFQVVEEAYNQTIFTLTSQKMDRLAEQRAKQEKRFAERMIATNSSLGELQSQALMEYGKQKLLASTSSQFGKNILAAATTTPKE